MNLELLFAKESDNITLSTRYCSEKCQYALQLLNDSKLNDIMKNSNKTDSTTKLLEHGSNNTTGTLNFSINGDYGRFYAKHSYVNCKREVRAFLCKDLCSDLDMVGSAPSDMLDLCKHFKLHYSALDLFLKNREKYFEKMIKLAPTKIDRGDCKDLVNSMLFGGDIDQHLFMKMGFEPHNLNIVIKQIRTLLHSIAYIRTELIEKLKEFHIWNQLEGEEKSKFAIIMQHIESRKIRKIYEICNAEGYDVEDIQHDGLLVSKDGNPINPAKPESLNLIKKLITVLKDTFGLNVKFKFKPFDVDPIFAFNVGIKHTHNQYCESKLRPFNNSFKYTIVKGFYGTGKTYQCLNTIDTCEYKKVLWLTPRRKFAQSLFQRQSHGFKMYLDLQGRNWTYDRLICQINSLYKINDNMEYDCIICDEIESVLSMFSASIMGKTRRDVAETFERLCKSAKRLIFGDNDISNRTWDLFSDWNLSSDQVCFEDNLFVKDKGSKYAMKLDNKRQLKYKLSSLLKEGKKVFLFSSTKSYLEKELKPFMETNYGSDSYLMYVGGAKKESMFDAEKEWANPDIRLVMCTSTITVGVDFNLPNVFDNVLGYLTNNVGAIRNAFQALHRVRQPKSPYLWYCSDKSSFTYKHELCGLDTASQVKEMIKTKVRALMKSYSEEEYGGSTAPTWFNRININNKIEEAKTVNSMDDEIDKFIIKSGYEKIIVTDVDEYIEKKNDQTESIEEEVNYDDIPEITSDEYDIIDYQIKRQNYTEADYYAYLKYQFRHLPEYAWDQSPQLFPLMFTRKGRRTLKQVRCELNRTSVEDLLKQKLNNDYVELIDNSALILKNVYEMNNLLSLENSISSKKIPRSTFDDPNISSLLTYLQQYNLIPKNRSNVNCPIAKVNSLYRAWSGQEFKPAGRIQVNGTREKVYQFRDNVFD